MDDILSVMVVDDHPVNRLVLGEIFAHLGCRISTAESGAEALALARREHFDLICLDRHMPALSGDEVAEMLDPDDFVLAWSTDTTDLPDRFNGVLSKPVSLAAAEAAMVGADLWRAALAKSGRKAA